MDLVNSILSPDPEKNILSNLELIDREIEPDNMLDRGYRLDLLGETTDGTKVNIEVQTTDRSDMDKRSLCYWAKIYGSQLSKGMQFRDLKPTYMINILAFNFFHDNDDYINRFHISNMKSGAPLNNQLRLHFLEIPKWTSLSIKSRNRLEKWLTFLSNKDVNELYREYPNDKLIYDAISAETLFMSNPTTRMQYEKHEEYLLDVTSAIYNSREEGIEIGVEIGVNKEKYRIAMNMLNKGMSVENIKEISGLSIEEIENIKKNL